MSESTDQAASDPATERTRVAAYAVCRDEAGRVLLCHIAPWVGAGDLWTLPGGGLEFGEAPADGVLRELAEETGHSGEVTSLLDVGDRVFDDPDGGRMHAIRIVYTVRIVGGVLRDEPDGSTDTCRWFAPDELAGIRVGELARRALGLDRGGR
jgi:8-oxo-dGTP diphosphatase